MSSFANSVFVDTGRYYTYAQKYKKYTAEERTLGTQSIGTFGPDGRYAHRVTWPATSGPPFANRFTKTIQPANNTAILATRYRRSALAGFGMTIAQIFGTGPFALCSLVHNEDSTISFVSGEWSFAGGDVRATSSTPLAIANYGRLEWRVRFGNPGTVALWLDGGDDLILEYSGNIGTTQWTSGSWGMRIFSNIGSYAAVTVDYLDNVLRDGTVRAYGLDGTTLLAGDDPWGDTKVLCYLSLTGNGHYTDLTPLTGSNHGDMVKEAQEDDDTSYNYSAEPDKRDSYAMEPIASDVGAVLLTQEVSVARKIQAGAATLNPFLRTNDTDYDGDARQSPSTVYQHYRSVFTALGGNPITVAALTAAESGVLISATVDPPGNPDPPPDPGSGGDCAGDGTHCVDAGTAWDTDTWRTYFFGLLAAHGLTVSHEADLATLEAEINAHCAVWQHDSGGTRRPRLYLPSCTPFARAVDVVSSWGQPWIWTVR